MAQVTLGGNPIHTNGELPAVGSKLPNATLTGVDLKDVSLADVQGKKVLNIFPSVDTGVCAASIREFNKRAAGLDGVSVLCISNDLPFAMKRFCGAEGIENVHNFSGFRSSFASDFGVEVTDSGFAGLMARAVVVTDADNIVKYVELVPEIGQEPNYDAAIAGASAR